MTSSTILSLLVLGFVLLQFVVSRKNTPVLPITIKEGTTKFYDSDGRQRLFHGFNVVSKLAPYFPSQEQFDPFMSFNEEDIELFNTWGFNVIRLGFLWVGAEPTNGTFNETYFQNALNLVNAAGQGGIYSLIDAHQDLFSERFCADGSPLWTMPPLKQSFPEPLAAPYAIDNSTGFPSQADCGKFPWFADRFDSANLKSQRSAYYFTEEVAAAFQALYSNEYNLRDSYTNFWAEVSNLYKGNPNIIGFELINEPFAGDIFKDILLMEPEQADFKNLQPFYDAIAPTIHSIDPTRLVFFEPVTWSDLAAKGEFAVGFTHVPGGPAYNSTSVLAFHYYVPMPNFDVDGTIGYFKKRLAAIASLSSGGMLTEFMIDGSETESHTADVCDETQVSWTGWIYKPFTPGNVNDSCSTWTVCPNGTINDAALRLTSRTYAQAVAGDIVSMRFNTSTGDFLLVFTPNSKCTLPTEIYLNQLIHYPNGFNVDVVPMGGASWTQPEANYLEFTNKIFNSDITIVITKK